MLEFLAVIAFIIFLFNTLAFGLALIYIVILFVASCFRTNPVIKVTKEFAATQLIGQDRFIKAYDVQLKALAENVEFADFVAKLRRQLNGRETTDTKVANQQISDYFYKNKANDRFPEVKIIVQSVKAYGKQASAHISIYYAMFLYEQQMSGS